MSALFPKFKTSNDPQCKHTKKKYELYCQHVISVFIKNKNWMAAKWKIESLKETKKKCAKKANSFAGHNFNEFHTCWAFL